LTTVGYGDMQGTLTIERIYSTMWILIGVAFYSFMIGNITSIVSSMGANSSELAMKLNTLSALSEQMKQN